MMWISKIISSLVPAETPFPCSGMVPFSLILTAPKEQGATLCLFNKVTNIIFIRVILTVSHSNGLFLAPSPEKLGSGHEWWRFLASSLNDRHFQMPLNFLPQTFFFSEWPLDTLSDKLNKKLNTTLSDKQNNIGGMHMFYMLVLWFHITFLLSFSTKFTFHLYL